MANLLLQVTIPASGKVQISTALPVPTGGKGDVIAQPQIGNIYVQQLIIQNNGSNNMRIGDATVSATKGILLAKGASAPPGGSLSNTGFINYGTYLSDWWIAGTAGDVADILYIQ